VPWTYLTYFRKLLGYLKLISHGITGARVPTRKKNRSAADKNCKSFFYLACDKPCNIRLKRNW
jgi:hypothetical protein